MDIFFEIVNLAADLIIWDMWYDLIATGGTALAAGKLLNKFHPKSIEFYFIINLSNLSGLKKLEKKYTSSFIIKAEG